MNRFFVTKNYNYGVLISLVQIKNAAAVVDANEVGHQVVRGGEKPLAGAAVVVFRLALISPQTCETLLAALMLAKSVPACNNNAARLTGQKWRRSALFRDARRGHAMQCPINAFR